MDSEQASLFFPHIILTQNYFYCQYFYTPSKALGSGYRLQHLIRKDQISLLASAYIRYPLLGGFENLILLSFTLGILHDGTREEHNSLSLWERSRDTLDSRLALLGELELISSAKTALYADMSDCDMLSRLTQP